MTADRVLILIRFIEFLQIVRVTTSNYIGPRIYTLCQSIILLSLLCLHQSSGNGSNGGYSPSSWFPNCRRASATATLDEFTNQLSRTALRWGTNLLTAYLKRFFLVTDCARTLRLTGLELGHPVHGVYLIREPGPRGWGSLRWNSKVWLQVLRDSDYWEIALQIADPSSRQRGRPTETRLQISDSNIPTGSNIWAQVSQGCSIARDPDWPSVVK
jgi:hypothetical protein